MKFYGREKELSLLRDSAKMAERSARFTVVTGRRRVGKTRLILKAFEDETLLYFFVARKSEKDLCNTFQKEINDKLNIPQLGVAEDFASLFEYLMKLSTEQSFTLVIDEFQDFLRINPSIYSDMQRIWDLYHERSRINLVVSGSIYRLMSKIFKDRSEPLYGRQTGMLHIRPFGPAVLKQILGDYKPDYNNSDLLAMYAFTGGVAKYVELLVDERALTREEIIEAVIKGDSMFLNEGKFLLVDEFGKDYSIYFSILTAIASGHTTRKEIEDVVGKEVGGYLTKLEDEYELICKTQPLFESAPNKNVKYRLNDRFLIFWFRFIYKYNYILEIMAYDQLRALVNRDYATFAGKALEQYFKELMIESGAFTRIGSWWDRKGENEIDLICENELTKTVDFYEVKSNRENYRESLLTSKIEAFMSKTGRYGDYAVTSGCLSIEDM